MKRATLIIAGLTLAAFVASPALAQNSKFSAMIDKVNLEVAADNNSGGDSDSRSRMTTVKLPGNKALLLGVSAQIAIDTSTKVVGKQGGGGSAKATGDVAVAVAVVPAGTAEADITPDDYAEPGEITFSMRSQDLSAVLGGVLVDCTVDLVTGEFTSEDCNFTNEEIALILETTAAHHYNFIWEAPATGEYDVWLLVDADATAVTVDTAPQDDGTANEASADVVVGPTVVSIEEVRPAKGGIVEFN